MTDNEEKNSYDNDKLAEVKKDDVDQNAVGDANDDDFAPTTVVVMLGSMNFEPVDSINIMSLKIQDPDERSELLQEAAKNVRPNSLESMHVLLKSSSVSTLFHESILTSFFDGIIPGKKVTVHVLPESAVLADDMAVQAGDVDSIRMGLVLAGLMLQVEQEHEGSWILTSTKPGGPDDSCNGEEEAPAETEDEEEFRKLVSKEIEANP